MCLIFKINKNNCISYTVFVFNFKVTQKDRNEQIFVVSKNLSAIELY